ncbi:hypothetical protein K503DRAFT_427510 [Rhizopogon vinicolor AM-OR11-026]|uniref:Uncharacterized protein n=1 Tax=Rhizopogon vinicolor AM-OR11-026 TaxID=1314800 RepID=A0A1B7NAS1_9AGAM|nr:hypothetical protein K503DRAFT_427510 [Rhizopogon vinicolor AM-OR11-026]
MRTFGKVCIYYVAVNFFLIPLVTQWVLHDRQTAHPRCGSGSNDSTSRCRSDMSFTWDMKPIAINAINMQN